MVLEGKGTLTLRPGDYVTSGGEGAIYRVGSTVVKLYADAEKMRRDGLVQKITLLKKLAHPFIVAPSGVVSKVSGEPIGFHMPFAEGEPLSRVFTNDFRLREGFTDESAKVLVARMRDVVEFAHGAGAVLVDANELNWLARVHGPDSPSPSVIDVDSWAIGKFGASVIMPSIRDWHRKGFDQLSDWFAWGVVTFQLWTGIHPYKGRLDGYGPGDLEKRMKANKSIFTRGVHLNRAVRDIRVIPAPLCAWYEAMFEHGERTAPPSPFETGASTPRAALTLHVTTDKSGSLVYEKLFASAGNLVVRVWPCGVLLLRDGSLVDLRSKRTIGKLSGHGSEVIKVSGGWLIGNIDNGMLALEYIAEATAISERLTLPLSARALFRSENRLFAVTESGITEIILHVFGKPVLAVGSTWGAPVQSTQFFDGVGLHDALGAKFLVLPFGDSACAMVRAPELDGLTIVSGKACGRFVAMTAIDRKGKHERIEFMFDREHGSYTLRRIAVDSPELNMTILPKGVVASIENDGELIIYVPSSGKVVKVADKHLATDMLLARSEDQVLYVENGAVWNMQMR